jgi:hypothetical protein
MKNGSKKGAIDALGIDDNVPIPRGRYDWISILNKMKVGQSFAIPEDVSIGSARICANRYGRAHGKKFIVRRERCWRTE